MDKRLIIICNFYSDETRGILKVIEATKRNSCFVKEHLYKEVNGNWVSKITNVSPYLYISQTKIAVAEFENWQILLVSDILIPSSETYPASLFNESTFVMYHTVPEGCNAFLSNQNVYAKKEGQHEPFDPFHGYPLINNLIDAYICNERKFDGKKFDEAIKIFSEWFKTDPLKRAKIELIQKIQSGNFPEKLGGDLEMYNGEFQKLKHLSNTDFFNPEFQSAFQIFYKTLEIE